MLIELSEVKPGEKFILSIYKEIVEHSIYVKSNNVDYPIIAEQREDHSLNFIGQSLMKMWEHNGYKASVKENI